MLRDQQWSITSVAVSVTNEAVERGRKLPRSGLVQLQLEPLKITFAKGHLGDIIISVLIKSYR
jgi:hypothetical protein